MNLLYVLGGLILLGFARLGTTAAGLAYEIAAVRFRGMQGINPVFVLTFRFTNPALHEIKLNSAFVNISIQNAVIAEVVEANLNQSIAGQSATQIDFPVTIRALDLPAAVRSVVLAGRLPEFSFSGNLRANGLLVPVRGVYRLPLSVANG